MKSLTDHFEDALLLVSLNTREISRACFDVQLVEMGTTWTVSLMGYPGPHMGRLITSLGFHRDPSKDWREGTTSYERWYTTRNDVTVQLTVPTKQVRVLDGRTGNAITAAIGETLDLWSQT